MNFRHPWLREVIATAHDAGRAIMDVYGRDFDVTHKTDSSPLTEADQAAHRLIAGRLRALTPDIPVLSEEEIDLPEREHWGQGRYWLVDPLDGTREFIKRNGEFTVNIALVEQGRPVLGVVHAPALGWSYAAAAGEGAFKRVAGSAPHHHPLSPEGRGVGERVQTAKQSDIDNESWQAIHCATHKENSPWRVVGSRSHAGDSLQAVLDRLGSYELVPMGSSLKLCLVAEGAADLYPRLGPTSLWDTAAAQCVVEEAGGRVVDLAGNPLRYGDTAHLLNPQFLVCGSSDLSRLMAVVEM